MACNQPSLVWGFSGQTATIADLVKHFDLRQPGMYQHTDNEVREWALRSGLVKEESNEALEAFTL